MPGSRWYAGEDQRIPEETVARDPLLVLADRHLIRYVPGFAPFLVERARGSWVWDCR